MSLNSIEFLGRFVQHVLPDGFVRIRHFGFLANRCRKEKIARVRLLLSWVQQTSDKPPETSDEACANSKSLAVDNDDVTTADETSVSDEEPHICGERCPKCNKGRMRPVEGFGPQSTWVYERRMPIQCDTS